MLSAEIIEILAKPMEAAINEHQIDPEDALAFYATSVGFVMGQIVKNNDFPHAVKVVTGYINSGLAQAKRPVELHPPKIGTV